MSFSQYLKPIGLKEVAAEAYDKVSEVLYAEYLKCIDAMGVGFEAPAYTCTPLVLANIEDPLGNISYYSYDTIIAVCLVFNEYIGVISEGLKTPPPEMPIYPPSSLVGITSGSLVAKVRTKTHESVDLTKPGTPPQDESLPFAGLFYGVCGEFIYNIYKDA
jgi:hypothetical protein